MNDGDWVEGEVQWWWKYVFPARARFWAAMVAAERVEAPEPTPWFEGVAGQLLGSVALLGAAVRAGDPGLRQRLKGEAIKKMTAAGNQVPAGEPVRLGFSIATDIRDEADSGRAPGIWYAIKNADAREVDVDVCASH